MTSEQGSMKRLLLGNILVAMAMLLFTTNQLICVYSRISVIQLLFCRNGLQLLITCVWWFIQRPTSPVVVDFDGIEDSFETPIRSLFGDSPNRTKIWIRGALMATVYPLTWYGVLTLPLGDFNCIMNLYPLLTVYLAHFLLKEGLPPWYILLPATILSFGGVVLVCQPSFVFGAYAEMSLDLGGLLSTFAAAIIWTFVLLLIRTVTASHFLQLEFAASTLIFFATVPVLLMLNHFVIGSRVIGDWQSEDWNWSAFDCLCLVFAGCAGFCDMLCLNIGYQLGDATAIGWIEYTQIPITYLFQLFVLDQGADTLEIVGAVAVTVGCLLPMARDLWRYCKTSAKPSNSQGEDGDGEVEEESEDEDGEGAATTHYLPLV